MCEKQDYVPVHNPTVAVKDQYHEFGLRSPPVHPDAQRCAGSEHDHLYDFAESNAPKVTSVRNNAILAYCSAAPHL